MSTLQLSLIAAGMLFVVAVWIYNLCQEYKHRRNAERILVSERPGTDRNNAVTETAIRPGEVEIDQRIEPVMIEDKADGEASAAAVASAVIEPGDESVDPLVEVVAGIDFAQDVDFVQLQSLASVLEARLTKPSRMLVWLDGCWQLLDATHGVTRNLRITLQLADRRGPLAAAEIDQLLSALRKIAEENGGVVRAVDVVSATAAAQSLDGRCAAIDVQIALHLVPRGDTAFDACRIKELLANAGMALAADGSFQFHDDSGRPCFSVTGEGARPFNAVEEADENLAGITFWLDVPRVADGAAVFEKMATLAVACGAKLDGVLVDDQRKSLGRLELTGIAGKIAEIQAQMAAAGMPAGGQRALRLFA